MKRGIAIFVALAIVGAFTASAVSARPPSTFRNWAQTPGNTAGVVYHPGGDLWEVWHNVPGDAPSAIRVEYNYKGVKDRWKTAVQQIVLGLEHFTVERNVLERRRIFFRIIESKASPISEYPTS
jgi:hypothetical protein